MKQALRLAAVLIGVAVSGSACSRCGPGARPATSPNVLALVLEVQETGVRVLSARPSRGRVVAPSLADRMTSLRHHDSLWIEYSLRSGSDAVLQNGALAVSMTLVGEKGGPGQPGGITRVRRRIVTVPVPYNPDARSVVFTRAQPSDAPPEQWQRVPAGTSPLQGQAAK